MPEAEGLYEQTLDQDIWRVFLEQTFAVRRRVPQAVLGLQEPQRTHEVEDAATMIGGGVSKAE